MSKNVVSQLLSGDQNISLKRLVAVALTLSKNVEVDLVDHDPPEVEAVPTKTKRLDIDGGTTQKRTDRLDAWSHRTRTGPNPDTTVHVNGRPVPSGDVDDDPAA